jgi:hypothetical protein
MKFIRIAVIAAGLAASSAQAVALFTSGPPVTGDSICNSYDVTYFLCDGRPNPSVTGWTVFTPFVLSKDSTVTGFNFANHIISTYFGTTWSIWRQNPRTHFADGPDYTDFTVGIATVTGLVVPNTTSSQPMPVTDVSITRLHLALEAGRYWIGMENYVGNENVSSYIATHNREDLPSIQISDDGTFINSVQTASFTISYVPEPATWALLVGGFGLTGMAMRRRQALVRVAC